MVGIGREWYEDANGLNTLTSNNASSDPSRQYPLALMSRRASWSVVVVCLKETSPERGCSWGSIAVSQPAFLRHDTSRLWTSLCRRIGSPPYRQLRACSIAAPQTHVVGRCETGLPYLRQRASGNARSGSFYLLLLILLFFFYSSRHQSHFVGVNGGVFWWWD